MRALVMALGLSLFPVLAHADSLPHVGNYTPALYAQASQGGNKAVLLHVFSKFCRVCEGQKAAILSASEMNPLLSRYVVQMDVPLETWQDSALLRDLGTNKGGTLILVRDKEVLGTVEDADGFVIADLLNQVLPPQPAIDPQTGLPLDGSVASTPSEEGAVQ